MSAPMANRKSTSHRRELALSEIDALAVNLIHDVRSLEAKLINAGISPQLLPELAIIAAGADCIRAELAEARRA